MDRPSIAPARGILNGTGVIPTHDLRGRPAAGRAAPVRGRTDPMDHAVLPRTGHCLPRWLLHDQAMQISAPATARPRARRPSSGLAAAAPPAIVGAAWLGIAVAAAWLVFATPLLARLVDLGSRSEVTPLMGAVSLAVALTAPAGFAIAGIARLGGAVANASAARGETPPVTRRAELLPDGCTVIPRVRLPDGRRLPEVVVGPHGVTLFESLPPAAATRRMGDRWEVRLADRTWRSIENPLQRAARDADRLRRHLETQERDFVVRVQAAVLGDPGEIARTDGCAVVRPDDVPAWLAAMPAQRGLTPDRLAHVVDLLSALA